MRPDLRVEIAGLRLNNPVMVASGTFGTGHEYVPFMDVNGLGALVTKTVTVKKRLGNRPPRIWETPSGMLNSIGLQNKGLETFVREDLPVLKRFKTPIIVNIAGFSFEDFETLGKALTQVFGVAALELNISCPNVKEEGRIFGSEPGLAARATKAVKDSTNLPVFVKLSPNVTDITAIAKAVENEGADALTVANTYFGTAIDTETFEPRLSTVTGGLSGPAIRPMTLRMVLEVVSSVKIPVVGVGGISRTNDALEYFLAGASAVQIGTANLVSPGVSSTIVEGLERFLWEKKIKRVQDIVGGVKID